MVCDTIQKIMYLPLHFAAIAEEGNPSKTVKGEGSMKKNKSLRETANSLYIKLGATLATALVLSTPAFAADSDFSAVVAPVVNLLNSLMTPLLAIVGAIGALYCVLLGVKFAKAEEPQDREKAKSHLKNAIIGFVLIFVLILILDLLMPVMINWVNANSGGASKIG